MRDLYTNFQQEPPRGWSKIIQRGNVRVGLVGSDQGDFMLSERIKVDFARTKFPWLPHQCHDCSGRKQLDDVGINWSNKTKVRDDITAVRNLRCAPFMNMNSVPDT
ncbi:MAG: hypothetical protein DI591_11925 [Citromicrobium sp.]|nr:MAG: hypothetical protein DI591_11925 [Citromicrobium sp.]